MAANQFSTDDTADEDKLDKALEDSFPASDPPSTSPITGTGPSPSYSSMDDEMDSMGKSRGKLFAMGAAAIGAILLVVMLVRRRRQKPSRLELIKHAARDVAKDATSKAKDKAQPLTDRLAA